MRLTVLPLCAVVALGFAYGCASEHVEAPTMCSGAQAQSRQALDARYAADLHPLLVRAAEAGGCATCHGPGQSPGRKSPFTVWPEPATTMKYLWSNDFFATSGDRTLLAMLARGDDIRMPLGASAWSEAEQAQVASFACDLEASGLDPCESPDAGNVLLRRLSNFEYDRTVASALGDTTAPSPSLAADDHAHGFDAVASAQTLSFGHLERYHDAAARLAKETLLVPAGIDRALEAETLPAFIFNGQAPKAGAGQGSAVEGHYHFENIRSYLSLGLQPFPFDGTYTLTVLARGQNAEHWTCEEPEPYAKCVAAMDTHGEPWKLYASDVAPQLRVMVDGSYTSDPVDVVGIPKDHTVMGAWKSYSFTLPMIAGPHSVRVWAENPVLWGREELKVMLDVDSLVLSGPLVSELPKVDQARIDRFLICEDWACGEEALRHGLTALWRRPAKSEEIARYASLLADANAAGETFKDGLEAVLEAALLSPNFLFRPELDAAPDSDVPETRPLESFELATRLSYFLWSAPPDAELLARASEGHLNDEAVLDKELERMLVDPRASALVDHFAGAWLQYDALKSVAPNAATFPDFDDALRSSMAGELRALVADAFDHDRTIFSLLDAPYTFLDARLAKHYGIDGKNLGSAFEKTDVSEAGRGGLLTTAGVLTLTSHPEFTSPTKRGKWILEQLLCRPPGAPPPNVNTNITAEELDDLGPKELLKLHAAEPQCRGCHAAMDPLGFTFEHFDAVGQFRQNYPNGSPVDASAMLPDDTVLTDHQDTIDYVKNDPGFPACVTNKLLIYALGSDPQRFDACATKEVERSFRESGHTLRGLVRAIVLGPMFRTRRSAKPDEYADIYGKGSN